MIACFAGQASPHRCLEAALARGLHSQHGMKARQSIGSCLLAVAPWLVACGGDGNAELGAAHEQPFSTAPQEPNHEDITQSALGFLRPEVLAALVAANVETDVQFALVNANHFDDCNFSGGSQVVSSHEDAAVKALDPSAVTPESDAEAIVNFARSLHAVQDFYAHSNWVESGGQTLVDASYGPFPTLNPYQVVPSSGFVIVQGRKPAASALSRKDDAAYPENAVVTYRRARERARGLISGTVDYEPGNYCPDAVAMTHDELNKDKSTLAGREAEHEAAKALAIQQTRHEWCRLSALMTAAYADAGSTRLLTWIADSAATPDCTSE